jgi:hypothetical protein
VSLVTHFRNPVTGRNMCKRLRTPASGPGNELTLTDDWTLVSCKKCDMHRRIRGEETYPVGIFELEWQKLGTRIAAEITRGELDGDAVVQAIEDATSNVWRAGYRAKDEAKRLVRMLDADGPKRTKPAAKQKPARVLRLVPEEQG